MYESIFLAGTSGTPPGLEANAEEAPHFKEAQLNALLRRREAILEANALPSMRLLASLKLC